MQPFIKCIFIVIQIQRFYHNYKNLRAILAFTILLKRSILNATKSISCNDCMSDDEIMVKLFIILSFLCKNLNTKNKKRHTIFWSFFIFFKQIDLCLVFFCKMIRRICFITIILQQWYKQDMYSFLNIINIMILIFCVIIKIYEILMFSDDGKDG